MISDKMPKGYSAWGRSLRATVEASDRSLTYHRYGPTQHYYLKGGEGELRLWRYRNIYVQRDFALQENGEGDG